jgi:HlyD family secretion protein
VTARLSGLLLLCVLAACRGGPDEIRAQGYVEGEYLNVSPQVTGRIEAVMTREGAIVAAGTPLIRLDPREAEALRDQAAAELARAQANLGDAEAGLRRTEREFHRQEDLVKRKVSAEAAFDGARQAYESNLAQLEAGKKAIEAARAGLAQAEWQVSQRLIPAPASGMIDEIYDRPGEVAVAGRPVLSILPAENRKVRFFVRQADLPRIKLGTQIFIACDGCGPDIPARVTYISNEAEFTPPVIYSLKTRDKLVFKIEARPVDAKAPLKIGQPVEVLVQEGT